MENPKPKKPLLEDYRDNLANDLREMRNLGDAEDARNVLDEERKTRRYQMAEDIQAQEREGVQEEYKKRKENKVNEEKNSLEKYNINLEQKEKFEIEMRDFLKSVRFIEGEFEMKNFILQNPLEVNTRHLENSKYPEKFGEFMTNPETAFLDYSQLSEPEIFQPLYADSGQRFIDWLYKNGRKNYNKGGHGFSKADVMDYVIEKYKDEYYIPGVEYLKYLSENPDKLPEYFKDKKNHPGDFRLAVMGSVICEKSGFNSEFYSTWIYEKEDSSLPLEKQRVWGETRTSPLWAQNSFSNSNHAYVFFRKPKKTKDI